MQWLESAVHRNLSHTSIAVFELNLANLERRSFFERLKAQRGVTISAPTLQKCSYHMSLSVLSRLTTHCIRPRPSPRCWLRSKVTGCRPCLLSRLSPSETHRTQVVRPASQCLRCIGRAVFASQPQIDGHRKYRLPHTSLFYHSKHTRFLCGHRPHILDERT
jgi:hypothetical protein